MYFELLLSRYLLVFLMAGLYIHIPFCKTRCIYCDFYSTTRDDLRRSYVQALCREMSLRYSFLSGEKVQTIYLGGGTPSQLDEDDFQQIFAAIGRYFQVAKDAEITVEVNPDDITPAYASMLDSLPFNRVSMGIQTFNDDILRFLHRRHTSIQAVEAVDRLRKAGFRNISVDLIYGLPGETRAILEEDVRRALSLQVQHISAYHLSYEEGTVIDCMLKEHVITTVSEAESVDFYRVLTEMLKQHGYRHYEISNYCMEGYHSRHNSSYWSGAPYLGLGPSAHSYDGGNVRCWNVSSLTDYIREIERGETVYEVEHLDLVTRYNEFLMVGLRTAKGISLSRLEKEFGISLLHYCRSMARDYITRGKLQIVGDTLKLTPDGVFVSDGIISDLMYVD